MSALYKGIIGTLDKIVPQKFQPFWKHPTGPKTIFFWAPVFKWGLVIAGLGDLRRPPDKISMPQSTALAATGLIWCKYSMDITPKNYILLSVNIFIAATALYQISRFMKYQNSLKK